MPWNVSGVVDQRKGFVDDYKSGEWTMAELCRRYGISRETGYQRMERYRLVQFAAFPIACFDSQQLLIEPLPDDDEDDRD